MGGGAPEERIVVWEEGEEEAEKEGGWSDDHVGTKWRIAWLAVRVIVDLHSEETHLGCCCAGEALEVRFGNMEAGLAF